MSPRAAWRLESLGFDDVCDYVAGKQDWLAYGLPIEGELAEAVTVGQVALRDVPVCRLEDKLSELAPWLHSSGWSECVVANEAGIVFGLLHKWMWQGASNELTAEQAMEPAPITFRPHVRRDEIMASMEKKKMESALVTTADGKLLGLLHREGTVRS